MVPTRPGGPIVRGNKFMITSPQLNEESNEAQRMSWAVGARENMDPIPSGSRGSLKV